MLPRRTLLLATAVAAVLTGLPRSAATAEQDDMGAMATSAKTKADHERVAAMFDAKAATAKAEAERHKRMADSYRNAGSSIGKGYSGGSPALVAHCDALAKSYGEAAAHFEALAKAHREMAAAAGS
jgi:uncharacterized membrane protein YqiK